MSDQINYGLIGDVQNTQNLAVGQGAKIEVHNSPPVFVAELEALADAVQRYDGPQDTRAELIAARDEVVSELERPRPDKARVLRTLSALARTAGSASTIVTAATALATAVQAVL